HVARGVFNAGIPMDAGLYTLVDSLIYSFHMPLFFLLSGYFFIESTLRRGAINQSINKFNTIFYVFIIWSILHGLVEVGLSQFTTNQLSLSELTDLSNHPRNHFWFLFALFVISFISAYIYAFAGKKWHVLVLVVGAFLYIARDNIDNFTAIDYFFMGSAVFFMFGVSLSIWLKSGRTPTLLFVAILGILTVFAQWYYHIEMAWTWDDAPAWARMLLAILTIYFVVSLCQRCAHWMPGVFAYLGKHSLEIYLMHLIAGSGIRIVLQKFAGIESVPVHLAVGTLLGIVLPLIGMYMINVLRMRFLFEPPFFLRIPYINKP
ncbi:MAG: acyltransferase family protein, partial [Pontibacterium sp.]